MKQKCNTIRNEFFKDSNTNRNEKKKKGKKTKNERGPTRSQNMMYAVECW